MKITGLFIVLFLGSALCSGAESNPDFNYRSGAKALALGEGGAAVSGGWESMFWNPAGLSKQKRYEAGLTHTDWNGLSLETAGFAMPLFTGGLGLAASFNSMPALDSRDISGNVIGSIDYNNLAIHASYGISVGMFSAGAGLGYWQQQLAAQNLAGASLNAGAGWTAKGFSLGVSGFQLESNPSWQTSAGWEKGFSDISVSVGLGYIEERYDSRTGFGLEIGYQDTVALRLGYQIPAAENVADGFYGLTAGAGFKFEGFGLDYAMLFLGDFGQVHRVQLNYFWDMKKAVKPIKEKAKPVVKEKKKKKEVELKFVVPKD